MSDYMSTPRQNSSKDDGDTDISDVGYDVSVISHGLESITSMNTTFIFSSEFLGFVVELLPMIRESLSSIENKELKVIALLLAVGVFVLIRIFQQNVNKLDFMPQTHFNLFYYSAYHTKLCYFKEL